VPSTLQFRFWAIRSSRQLAAHPAARQASRSYPTTAKGTIAYPVTRRFNSPENKGCGLIQSAPVLMARKEGRSKTPAWVMHFLPAAVTALYGQLATLQAFGCEFHACCFYERGACASPWKRRPSTPASHVTESQARPEAQGAGAEIALERGRASGLSPRGASTATTTVRRRALAMRSRVRATLRMGLTASTSRLLRAELCDWPKRSSAISSRMRSRTLNNGAIGNLASFG